MDYKKTQAGQYKLRKMQVHGGEIKTALNYAKEKKRHHHNLKKWSGNFLVMLLRNISVLTLVHVNMLNTHLDIYGHQ